MAVKGIIVIHYPSGVLLYRHIIRWSENTNVDLLHNLVKSLHQLSNTVDSQGGGGEETLIQNLHIDRSI